MVEKFGCTVVSDGWTDRRQRPLLNVLVFCNGYVYFVRTHNAEGRTKSMAWIAKFIVGTVEKKMPFAKRDCMAVVMDGANRFSFEEIEESLPWVECLWCNAHVLSLVLKDFAEIDIFREVVANAKEAVMFIYNHQKSLALFRSFKKRIELKKWCQTRFGTVYITCQSMDEENAAIKLTVAHPDYARWLRGKNYKELGATVAQKMSSASFWKKLRCVVKVTDHVFRVMRLLDSDKPTMGWSYFWMHGLVKKISDLKYDKALLTQRKVQKLTRVVNDRWEKLYGHMHGAGFLLNPFIQYSGYTEKLKASEKVDVFRSLKIVLKKYYHYKPQSISLALKSFAEFENAQGDFADPLATEGAQKKHDQDSVAWWQLHGRAHPHLQAPAMKILAQTSTASACERNWSSTTFLQEHAERLKPENLNKRVFVYANIRVENKMSKNYFEADEYSDPDSSDEEMDTVEGDSESSNDCGE